MQIVKYILELLINHDKLTDVSVGKTQCWIIRHLDCEDNHSEILP